MPKSKNGKIWDFLPPEGDRINRSKRNLVRGSALAQQMWPLSVKGLGTGPANVKIWPKLLFLSLEGINGFKWNLACKRRLWVYCLLLNFARISKRDGHKSQPQMWKFGRNCDVSAVFPHMGDIIYWSRLNLACKHRQLAHCCMPNLAQIGSLRMLPVLQRLGDVYGF